VAADWRAVEVDEVPGWLLSQGWAVGEPAGIGATALGAVCLQRGPCGLVYLRAAHAGGAAAAGFASRAVYREEHECACPFSARHWHPSCLGSAGPWTLAERREKETGEMIHDRVFVKLALFGD